MTEAATSDWRHRAECRWHDPETWFPVGHTGPVVAEQVATAKAICGGCPVRAKCLRWALDTGQEYGVWGGMSEDERRSMKRRLARARAASGGGEAERPKASVPTPQQALKGTRATRRAAPAPPRPRRDPPRDRSLVAAGRARDLIGRAYAAGLSRRAVATLVGADPQWVGTVGTGTRPLITAEYEAKTLTGLAEFADPGATPAAEGVGS